MATPHYVFAYMTSEGSSEQLPYYIHHKGMATMYVPISDQITLHTECLITYATTVWPLPTMYVLVSDQNDLLAYALLHITQEYGQSPLCMC
jgi:hypothetical protein